MIGILALAAVLLVTLTVPAVMIATGLDAVISTGRLRGDPALYGPLWAAVVLPAVYSRGWRSLLSAAPMRWLGEISFSLYLTHELVVAFVARLHLQSAPAFFCVIACALALSTVIWFVLEQPFRRIGYKLTGGSTPSHGTAIASTS